MWAQNTLNIFRRTRNNKIKIWNPIENASTPLAMSTHNNISQWNVFAVLCSTKAIMLIIMANIWTIYNNCTVSTIVIKVQRVADLHALYQAILTLILEETLLTVYPQPDVRYFLMAATSYTVLEIVIIIASDVHCTYYLVHGISIIFITVIIINYYHLTNRELRAYVLGTRIVVWQN